MSANRRLAISLAAAAAVALFEFWGGWRSHSIALITDAVHMCTDVLALALALLATVGAARAANRRKTFGYERLEVLGALFNGTLLLVATIFIAYEAVGRLSRPELPSGSLMTAVALIGLFVNGGIGFLLGHGAEQSHNLNLRAALFHVVGDALGAFAVVVGGIVIVATKATWIDPALSLFVAAIIVVGVVRVLRDTVDVLLEGAPARIDTHRVRDDLLAIDGVAAVHDLHIWSIGSGSAALTAHIVVPDRRISEATAILRSVTELARERFGIRHVTLQFECETCAPNEMIVCTQPAEQ